MEATISVIIPVKSDPNGLATTVDALLKIDRNHVEIIVVDGGGCPTTQSWLLEHQHEIDHVRSAKDGGVYDAMNYGKSCATGKWIWFLGAGDIPSVSALEYLVNLPAEQQEIPLHIFSVQMDADREAGVPASYPARWDASMYWRNTTHHQGVVYRRDLLKDRKFNAKWKVLSDYALHLSLFQSGIPFETHDRILANVKSGGLSRKFHAGLYREEWNVKRQILSGWRKWVQPVWLLVKFTSKQLGVPR